MNDSLKRESVHNHREMLEGIPPNHAGEPSSPPTYTRTSFTKQQQQQTTTALHQRMDQNFTHEASTLQQYLNEGKLDNFIHLWAHIFESTIFDQVHVDSEQRHCHSGRGHVNIRPRCISMFSQHINKHERCNARTRAMIIT